MNRGPSAGSCWFFGNSCCIQQPAAVREADTKQMAPPTPVPLVRTSPCAPPPRPTTAFLRGGPYPWQVRARPVTESPGGSAGSQKIFIRCSCSVHTCLSVAEAGSIQELQKARLRQQRRRETSFSPFPRRRSHIPPLAHLSATAVI